MILLGNKRIRTGLLLKALNGLFDAFRKSWVAKQSAGGNGKSPNVLSLRRRKNVHAVRDTNRVQFPHFGFESVDLDLEPPSVAG